MRNSFLVFVLAAGAACSEPPQTPAKMPPDAVLREAVKDALIGNSDVPAGKIDVEVRSGVVIMHGMVDSDKQRTRAEEVAAKVGGVTSVKNNLEVR